MKLFKVAAILVFASMLKTSSAYSSETTLGCVMESFMNPFKPKFCLSESGASSYVDTDCKCDDEEQEKTAFILSISIFAFAAVLVCLILVSLVYCCYLCCCKKSEK